MAGQGHAQGVAGGEPVETLRRAEVIDDRGGAVVIEPTIWPGDIALVTLSHLDLHGRTGRFISVCETPPMKTESVPVTKIKKGDIIRDPAGTDYWRKVEDFGYDTSGKDDGSGEYWKLHVFIGPFVGPEITSDAFGDQPGFDRFIYREDEQVTRRVSP